VIRGEANRNCENVINLRYEHRSTQKPKRSWSDCHFCRRSKLCYWL